MALSAQEKRLERSKVSSSWNIFVLMLQHKKDHIKLIAFGKYITLSIQTKQQMFKKVAQSSPADGNTEEKSPKRKSRRKNKINPTDILKPVPAQTDEEADTRKKMPKGLPSHWGAKVSSDFYVLNFQRCCENKY